MPVTISKLCSEVSLRNEIIDFEERPACSICNNPMTICSHSTPSKVFGFDGIYYTKYREYSCSNFKCLKFNKGKFRASNPWRVDRHKYDIDVESKIGTLRFEEKKTYREIKKVLLDMYNIETSQKAVGNIISRYEISCKLESQVDNSNERKKLSEIFVSVDTMAPTKGEEKHIVAMDNYTGQVLLVDTVKSENTEKHMEFQRKLKILTRKNNIKLLGFMSDDHRAQRKAVKLIWGNKMKHCRCLFHFEKRIMLEPFKLNSKLKTKAKARIRKIHYVKLFREEKLKSVRKSKVCDYLYEIIKDLVLLQTWKNKRNDTRLESIDFYERLLDIKDLLIELENYTSKTPAILYKREKKRLKIVLKDVKNILDDYYEDYSNLKRIKGYQDNLRKVFEAHRESSKIGFEKLMKYTKNLEEKLNSSKLICKEEKNYIKQLYTFVYDRGESLFHYRYIKNATNTNNAQESKFKKLKHDIKRTQGSSGSAKYFQRNAKYQIYVDPHATREEIREILLNADYKAVAKIMKEDREKYKRQLARIKNKNKWNDKIEQLRQKVSKK